jgi:hypothetical protein
MNTLEILIALAIVTGGAGIVFIARQLSYPPGNPGLFTVVAASGRADELEQTVNALLRYERAARVVIADCGLEPETRRLAELLAQDARVELCRTSDLPEMVAQAAM